MPAGEQNKKTDSRFRLNSQLLSGFPILLFSDIAFCSLIFQLILQVKRFNLRLCSFYEPGLLDAFAFPSKYSRGDVINRVIQRESGKRKHRVSHRRCCSCTHLAYICTQLLMNASEFINHRLVNSLMAWKQCDWMSF